VLPHREAEESKEHTPGVFDSEIHEEGRGGPGDDVLSVE